MATYTYLVVPVSKDGSTVYNSATAKWVDTKTQLDLWGAAGWEVVATLDTTFQRQIILKKTTT